MATLRIVLPIKDNDGHDLKVEIPESQRKRLFLELGNRDFKFQTEDEVAKFFKEGRTLEAIATLRSPVDGSSGQLSQAVAI